MITLKPHGEPDQYGKQRYIPVQVVLGRESQYREGEYALEGLEGYWMWPEKGPEAKQGQKYRVWLTTKPKTGAKAKPGSKYQDVVRAEPITNELGDEFIDVTEPSHPDDAPVESPETAPEAPETKVSPLAGTSIPAEWRESVDYWMWKESSSRISIETQTALKALVEALPSVEDPATRLQFTNAIMELAARLGRFTWSDPEIVEDAGE